jgi:hypothetical protein
MKVNEIVNVIEAREAYRSFCARSVVFGSEDARCSVVVAWIKRVTCHAACSMLELSLKSISTYQAP